MLSQTTFFFSLSLPVELRTLATGKCVGCVYYSGTWWVLLKQHQFQQAGAANSETKKNVVLDMTF